MPQLDPSSFIGQLFWLAVTFGILYLLMWRVALPRIADLLQTRQERIDDDLERAERLRNDAAEALEAYDKAIAKGRENAQAVLLQATEAAAAEAAARGDEIARRLATEAEAAERRIKAARDEALGNVRTVAAEVAQAAAARLIGAAVSESEAEGAVGDTMRERG